jgi:catechol 2,3-dioxygenase-like lactoylglutathione lyase family enzyme
MGRTAFGSAAPILRVSSLAASVEYFVTVLGFNIDWEAAAITSVSRDRCCLFLVEDGEESRTTWAWAGVGDVEQVFEELRAKGARIRRPPTRVDWGMEMQVEDLDGNVLSLASARHGKWTPVDQR